MAVNDVFPKMLLVPTQLTTSSSTLFTVTTNYQWTVKQIVICNTDGVERWFSLAYNGASSTAANCFVYQLPIAAYDTVVLDTALVFDSGQTLRGQADTASKVTVCVTGWERQTA
jgi:hypothetical protein